jgi:hypothetical protein
VRGLILPPLAVNLSPAQLASRRATQNRELDPLPVRAKSA